MNKLLGANWQTTLWGWITLLCGAIALYPNSVAFLPDDIEGYVKGFAGLIALVTGGAFAAKVKDKNVTGGTVQQTADGSVASHNSQMTSDAVSTTKEATPKQ
jgi:hypothetical protein